MNYHHYCAFCIEGDVAYCTLHKKVLGDSAWNATQCRDYAESDLGSCFTGKKYVPRKKKEKGEQLKLI